jgi:SAM-dependent methyltransferase
MSKFYSRWKRPLIRTKVLSGLSKYPAYLRDWFKYSRIDGAEPIKLRDTYPCLFDKKTTTRIDSHYFYQDIWAFKKIYSLKPELHVDVGSSVNFVGFLTAITKVNFVDIRPLDAPYLANIENIKGSILELPYEDNSLESISCLHVAEHIGLGRYGDSLNPLGTKKAAAELSRCLAKGGNLFFSLPVGKPRLCFNAHRIHNPHRIIEYFSDLKLVELSGSTDQKEFIENIDITKLEDQKYACGMFQFTKE